MPDSWSTTLLNLYVYVAKILYYVRDRIVNEEIRRKERGKTKSFFPRFVFYVI
jgi:hypothetical protein